MNYEIVNLKEKLVEGVGMITTNENGKSMQDIGAIWKDFFEKGLYEKIENKRNGKTIGLYTDYENDYTKPYFFLSGAEVIKPSEVLEEKIIKVIPEGRYAKFVITGDVQKAVGELWSNIWQMNLDRKYTCDFEEYQEMIEGQAPEIHVYIAIR